MTAPTTLSNLVFMSTDLETTGLSPVDNDVLTLGAVAARMTPAGLVEIGRFEARCRPLQPANATLQAREINGLDPAAFADAEDPNEAIARFCAWSMQFGMVVVMGHNAAFDLRFIAAMEERAGVRWNRHPSVLVDTQVLCKAHLVDTGKVKSASLKAATTHYGLAHQAHDALADCLAVVAVADRIAKEAPALWWAFTDRAVYAADRLDELAVIAESQRAHQARLQTTPEWAALVAAKAAYDQLELHIEVTAEVQALERTAESIREGMQLLLDGDAGPVRTAHGAEAGYALKRSWAYSAATVKALLPDFAKDIIIESVPIRVMEKFAKAAIAAKKAPADVLDQLKATATCDVEKKWSLRLPEAPGDLAAARARLAASPAERVAALELAPPPAAPVAAEPITLEGNETLSQPMPAQGVAATPEMVDAWRSLPAAPVFAFEDAALAFTDKHGHAGVEVGL